MATQEARDLLDKLMGGDRNALLPKGAALQPMAAGNTGGSLLLPGLKTKSCYDADICPYYTAWHGINVYELFTNTKSDIGTNPRVCDDAARREYESLPPSEQERLGYESALFHKLQELVRQCDRTILRNREKLAVEVAQKSAKMNCNVNDEDRVDLVAVEHLVRAQLQLQTGLEPQLVDQVRQLQERVAQVQRPSESESSDGGGDSGDGADPDPNTNTTVARLVVAVAQTLSLLAPQLEQIEHQKRQLEQQQPIELTDKTVCEVSGNFMSSRDADERIAAHYSGKQYQGWKLVRDQYEAMRRKYGPNGPPRRLGGGGSGGSFRSGPGAPPPATAPLAPPVSRGGGGFGGGGGGGRWERGGPPSAPPSQYGGRDGGDRGGGGYRGGGDGRWQRGGGGGGGWRR